MGESFINQELTFEEDKIYFLTPEGKERQVMMSWEDALMKKHADYICQNGGDILEIGFGMGSSLIDMARKESKTNFLGIEVHKPGIGKTLNDVELYAIKNLKLICHDATEVFQNAFKNKSLDRILIYFPDPWPKKRHAKRRLIQTEFATIISEKLKIGGHLHLSTDWRPYADHMVSVLEKVPQLKNAIAQNSFWENPKRPETKFERRGKTLGNKIWDLLYKKE